MPSTNPCVWNTIRRERCRSARPHGAVGGKLVGAGGGGFLLFYADDRDALRLAMQREGLREVRFAFDHEGSKLLARD